MKQELKRRNFIRNIFNGVILSAMTPVLLSEYFMSCRPLQVYRAAEDGEDLKKLSGLIADKNKPIRWVFTGDSITQGAKHTHGFRSYPEIFSERMRFELNRPRDMIINTAISGHATSNILDDFEWRIQQFHPEVVSIMIGTNDAAASRNITATVFEKNLRLLVAKFRGIGSIPVLHTPGIIDVAHSGNDRTQLPSYVEIIRRVAGETKTILIDHWNYWEANREKVFTDKWLADPLHPGERGHLEMARLLFRTISIWDDTAFTCTGTVHF